jgi:hypothetical protein
MTTQSAIYFKSVEPVPCEFIPGGTIQERAFVSWEEDPIGTIVSRLSDKPPDPLSWGRVRTLWYFVPWGKDYPTVKCDTIVQALRKEVQNCYRGIFDLRNAPRGTRIASGDECEVETLVLKWSGMMDTWNAWEYADDHSFYREVLRYCPSVILKSKEWEGGGPGLSDTWFSVRGRNPAKLREEIASGIQNLMIEESKPPAKKPKSPRRAGKPRKE